jgi:uncharacterized repeat protein (TIGR01451 family)
MSKHFRFTLGSFAILVLLAGLSGPLAPPPAAAGSGKIAPEVLAQLEQEGQGTFLVYLAEQADLSPAYSIRDWNARGWFVYHALSEVAGRTQPAVLQALNSLQTAGHVSRVQSFWIINLIVVHGDSAAARAVAHLPEVAAVYPEMKIELVRPVREDPAAATPQAVEWNIQQIGAEQVWTTYNVTGTGAVVANIDTGVEYTHTALVRQYRGNLGGGNFDHNYNWWDPTFVWPYPYPVEGSHGTHVMGTECGDDGAGNQIGVAPGARWIAAYGCCPSNEALLSATQWMIAPTDLAGNNPDPTKRPYAVNNSWSGPGGSLIYNDLLSAQRAAGIFPAFAAANNGPGCATLGSPGDNPAAFNTGATTPGDGIASFSSRGPDPFHSWFGFYDTGPAITAPGTNIRSSLPGNNYGVMQGTSMASPHTAGAVALLWSAEPDLVGQVDETAEILRRTARPLTTTQTCGGVPGTAIPNNTFGWGRLDIKAAVDMLWHAGTLSGTVTDAVTAAPVTAARILMQRNGYTLSTGTDLAGDYEFLLGEGIYTVTVLAYGYQPWAQNGVLVLQDGITTIDVALTPLVTHTLAGVVQEGALQAAGDPVSARVGLRATSVDVNTDPVTGAYSAPAAEGSYWMRTIAPGYLPEDRTITVTGDLSEDVSLVPTHAYYFRDSRSPCGPTFQWVDATGGTPHNLGDDAYFSIDMSAHPFTFYGIPYNSAYVGSNGFISFGQGYSRGHMMIPFEALPNNAIYAFEEDLNPAGGTQGIIYHQWVADRYLVVEFYQVEHWASGYPETFEFILDTQRGTVELQYLEVSWPDYTTVGIENYDGSDGILYSYANSADITNSLAVAFGPIVGGLPADQGPLGVLGTLSGTVYVSGTTAPIAGAAVTATSYLFTFTTTTDLAGSYTFPDVCADLYWLQAGAAGYLPGPTLEARLRYAGDVAVNDFYLEPTQAQPAITKTVAMLPCGPLTYTISYANYGAGDLEDAVISDVLPFEVLYITSTPPGVYHDGAISWTVDIPAGGAGQVTIVGGLLLPPAGQRPSAVGWPVTNTAYLLWPGPALSASATFDYVLADPVLTKTVSAGYILPGGLVTYTLAYVNRGCDLLFDATLTDTLPPEVAYITSTPPGLYQDGAISWTVIVPPGPPEVVTVVGQLSSTAVPGTQVSNDAVLAWDTEVATATASFQVAQPGCEPVQGPAMAWSPSAPLQGEMVTFSATVAAGDPPFTFTWAFGDGATGQGVVVTHTYTAGGDYSVVLTATNCLGAGQAVTSDTLTVTGQYRIYLPLVVRGA